MKDLLILLNQNNFKIYSCTKDQCVSLSGTFDEEFLDSSGVYNPELLVQGLIDQTSQIVSKSAKPTSISFLLNPKDAFLSFITVSKNGLSVEEQIVESARKKLGSSLDDLYFSYDKIAPYVYQFIAVKKDFLNSLLEVSSLWGVPIKAIVPWSLILPKLVDGSDPVIFVDSSAVGGQSITLSDLNGVYFATTYEKEKSLEELHGLVKKLALYKREETIENIYSLTLKEGINSLADRSEGSLKDLVSNFEGIEEGFEVHGLYLKAISLDPSILSTSTNLLNILPVPEVRKPVNALIPVSVTLLVLGIFLGAYFLFGQRGDTTSSAIRNNTEVLSEKDEVPAGQTSDGISHDKEGTQDTNVSPEKLIAKEDAVIRIENGSGINGAAARTQALLEEKGYKVIEIGTAANQHETSQILIKKELLDLREGLKEDLEPAVPDTVIDTMEDSDASGDYNVLILLGKNITI